MSKNVIKTLDMKIIGIDVLYDIENSQFVKSVKLGYTKKGNKNSFIIDLIDDDSIVIFA